MDLEKLKQNLRLRSGRSRKARERQKPPIPPAPATAPGPRPTPQLTRATTRDQFAQTEKAESEDLPTKEQPVPASTSPEVSIDDSAPSAATAAEEDKSADTDQQDVQVDPSDKIAAPSMESQNQVDASDGSGGEDFDLRPPAPKAKRPSLETTTELLFSAGHLNAILHDQQSIARFTAFLNKYKPEYQPLILGYLETQKAIKAVEYANAVAASATLSDKESPAAVQVSPPRSAAQLDRAFEDASNTAFNALVGTALPMFVSYSLIKIVSECLVNEITGKQSAVMQNLVGGLSEVFCITDPNQEDNPIIYASEEFYRYTGYGSDDVIGHNCRFLQGAKTSRESPRRLKEATEKGEEICEAILNYRRDGRPFVNLLMIAPLYDSEGNMKYQIGAQVDVSGLVENGRGLDFFAHYLTTQQQRGRSSVDSTERKQKQLNKLRELSEMFDLEESAIVQTHSRSSSITRDDDAASVNSLDRPKALRRLFVSDSDSESDDDEEDTPTDATKDAWKLAQDGPQGRPSGGLPGVYDTYMLIRPAPSMRIIFVSRKLQKYVRSVQTPFLSHVTGPSRTLAGLKESFIAGVSVSAKISFSPQPSGSRDGVKVASGYKHEDGKNGKACWISATPMLGSDDRPGVWMVVFVEKSKAGAGKHLKKVEAEVNMETEGAVKPGTPKQSSKDATNTPSPKQRSKLDLPIKPTRLPSQGPLPTAAATNGDTSATEGTEKKAAESDSEDFHEADSNGQPPEDISKQSEIGEIQTDSNRGSNTPDAGAGAQEDKSPKVPDEAKAEQEQEPKTPSRPQSPSESGYESVPRSTSEEPPAPRSPSPERASQTDLDVQSLDSDHTTEITKNEEIIETPDKEPTPETSEHEVVTETTDNEPTTDTTENEPSMRTFKHDATTKTPEHEPSIAVQDEPNDDTPTVTRVHTRMSSPDRHNYKPELDLTELPSQRQLHASSTVSPPAQHHPRTSPTQPPPAEAAHEQDDADDIHSPAAQDEDTPKAQKVAPPRSRKSPGLVLDYLSHPGSRGPSGSRRVNAEEFGRALSIKRRERGETGGGDDGDERDEHGMSEWDRECLRSPYSVD